jgi:hypothetical protein
MGLEKLGGVVLDRYHSWYHHRQYPLKHSRFVNATPVVHSQLKSRYAGW